MDNPYVLKGKIQITYNLIGENNESKRFIPHCLLHIEEELLAEGETIWKSELLHDGKQAIRVEDIFGKLINEGEYLSWMKYVENEVDTFISNAFIIMRSHIHDRIRGSFNGSVNQTYGFGGKVRPGILHAVPHIAGIHPLKTAYLQIDGKPLQKLSRKIAFKMITCIRSSILKNITPGTDIVTR